MADKRYAIIDGKITRTNYSRVGKRCEWEGCEETSRAHGFCLRHYHRVRYSKELEHMMPEYARALRCAHEGCDEPAYSGKHCRNHYGRLKRNGNLDPYAAHINPLRFRIAMWMREMTFEDVAAKVGVARQRIHTIVGSKRCVYKRAKEIADALQVSVEWLSDPRPPEVEGFDPLKGHNPIDLSYFGTDPSKPLRIQQMEREYLQYSEVKRGIDHAINQMAILPRSLLESLDDLNTYVEDALEHMEEELESVREEEG